MQLVGNEEKITNMPQLQNFNIEQTDEAYHLEVDAPNLERENLNLSLDGDTLVITAHQKDESESDHDGFYFKRSQYGSFRQSWLLPEDAEPNNIEAKFKDGTLMIDVPKSKTESDSKSNKVSIQ